MTVERWAGNGGQMARERRKQAVQGKAGTSKKTKKLNEEALKLMDENAAGIAQLLCDSTLHGHMPSARLLVELDREESRQRLVEIRQKHTFSAYKPPCTSVLDLLLTADIGKALY